MKKDDTKELPFFVLRSKYREDVFFTLVKEKILTQSVLLDLTSPKYRSHMSRTIKELLEKDLIECKNPKEYTNKYYAPTKKGLRVYEEAVKYVKTPVGKKSKSGISKKK